MIAQFELQKNKGGGKYLAKGREKLLCQEMNNHVLEYQFLHL
jgi:hypothetical protein